MKRMHHFRPSKFAVGAGGAAGRGQLQRAVEIAARPEQPRAVSGMMTLISGMMALEAPQVDDISRSHLETLLNGAMALQEGPETRDRLAAYLSFASPLAGAMALQEGAMALQEGPETRDRLAAYVRVLVDAEDEPRLREGLETRGRLAVYVRVLVDAEDDPRLREICEVVFPARLARLRLAPPAVAGAEVAEAPEPRLFGISRRALLREVLDEMRRKRGLQRCREELDLLLREA
ncbi:hypothetical protein T484DRAFT_1806415 [Baffinella frigidus]|nr:hypothetical protein T484DRAFT_1806415 [Cryptophyta sp. CCMP2293]